jgi:hypothetical protein
MKDRGSLKKMTITGAIWLTLGEWLTEKTL